MAGAGDNPFHRVVEYWDEVVADMEATAAEYREDGWHAVELHPGDVAAVTDPDSERFGLDVVLPGNEYETVLELVESGSRFTSDQVFRAESGGVVFLVVAMEADTGDVVVLTPAYYDVETATDLREGVEAVGEMRTHLRPLETERIVTVSHDDPGRFFP